MTFKCTICRRSYKLYYDVSESSTSTEFIKLGSRLFHSIIVDEKEKFLNKLWLALFSGILAWFPVIQEGFLVGVILNK